MSLPHALGSGVLVMVSLHSQLAAATPTVEVSGALISINGTDTVPSGLFGVHATKLTPERIADWGVASLRLIDKFPDGNPRRSGDHRTPGGLDLVVECFYDRYQPALILTNPDWRRNLADLAQRYGERARGSDIVHHIEFWNEPYLNWSCKPGVNYDAAHYRVEDAVEGGPVTIRGQQEPTEHLVWTRGLRVVDAVTGKADYVAASRAPRDAKAGDTYVFRDKTYRLEDAWVAKDPTQRFYWAGEQNARWYREMYGVFARALKEANPEVQVAAGWGFNIWNEGWESWKQLYRPLIDEHLDVMDGIHEHHYGGETRLVAASYEVVTAYTDERGKRLRFYNTEAGGMLDPEKPDTPSSGLSGTPLQKAQGAMTYFLRDVIHLLDVCPDKAFARAAHEADLNGGDEFAFKLLKPLRGRLMEATSSTDDIWSVASIEGTRLTLVCFNDRRQGESVRVTVRPPPGLSLVSGTAHSVVVRGDGAGLAAVQTDLGPMAAGAWEGSVDLPTKAAQTLVFTLAGQAEAPKTRVVTQHYARGILARVDTGATVARTIALPADRLERATAARLKLVILDHDGSGRVVVNGTDLPLRPGSCTVRQDIDHTLLRSDTTLEFRATGKSFNLLMASIELVCDG